MDAKIRELERRAFGEHDLAALADLYVERRRIAKPLFAASVARAIERVREDAPWHGLGIHPTQFRRNPFGGWEKFNVIANRWRAWDRKRDTREWLKTTRMIQGRSFGLRIPVYVGSQGEIVREPGDGPAAIIGYVRGDASPDADGLIEVEFGPARARLYVGGQR